MLSLAKRTRSAMRNRDWRQKLCTGRLISRRNAKIYHISSHLPSCDCEGDARSETSRDHVLRIVASRNCRAYDPSVGNARQDFGFTCVHQLTVNLIPDPPTIFGSPLLVLLVPYENTDHHRPRTPTLCVSFTNRKSKYRER